MIELKQLQDFEMYAYGPEGQFMGILRHATSLLDLLLQIKKEEAKGYYLIDAATEKRYDITPDGRIEDNLYCLYDELLTDLVGF